MQIYLEDLREAIDVNAVMRFDRKWMAGRLNNDSRAQLEPLKINMGLQIQRIRIPMKSVREPAEMRPAD